MAQTINLCAQIPIDLHSRVYADKESTGLTTSEYITRLLIEYYKMNENGGSSTMGKTRTMAFQISEELFQRIKSHLERETARTGKKLTQREFILSLIEQALSEAECQAGVGPCEGEDTTGGSQPQADS